MKVYEIVCTYSPNDGFSRFKWQLRCPELKELDLYGVSSTKLNSRAIAEMGDEICKCLKKSSKRKPDPFELKTRIIYNP